MVGIVKDTKGITYSAPEMVERHYVARRERLLPDERQDIESLAAAYKLDEPGFKALADYMNKLNGSIKRVPPKANDVAKQHATVKLPKRNGKRAEPYIVEMPGYGTMPTKLDNTTF